MRVTKVGLLGGTFNPVHRGHTELAEAAIEEIGLDRVEFIPSAAPPHKKSEIVSFAHRIAMLDIVCSTEDRFIVNTIENELPKPSYTIDTLEVLMKKCDKNTHFFFIIGADAFLDIRTWKGFQDVLSKIDFILALRHGYDSSQLEYFLDQLQYLKRTVDKSITWAREEKSIYLLKKRVENVSSSKIRRLFAQNCANRDIIKLHPEILRYIGDHRLYSGKTD